MAVNKGDIFQKSELIAMIIFSVDAGQVPSEVQPLSYSYLNNAVDESAIGLSRCNPQ